MSKVNEIHLNSSTFIKMPRLRFLKFHGENKFKISHFEGEAFTELRYLYWDGYPSKSLPPVIRLDTLISLQLRESKVEQLWDGVPVCLLIAIYNFKISHMLLMCVGVFLCIFIIFLSGRILLT